ncbi:protease-4 [Halogeometricum rufum]|uniref:Protease-4 n=1 Tax=Halogeometricum rufum TaxID=553469 RepID=A0A1I6GGZ8_9EURY|nr:signal peptide peptidase SppA [Halogeometricum rufum]SFR41456.1 protease-4 [Halogeometricum rufum]
MTDRERSLERGVLVVAVAAVAGLAGWLLFYVVPYDLASLLGVLLVVATVFLGVRLGSRVASARFPDYDVAEVGVEGPITRDGGPTGFPNRPGGASSDDVVEQIRAADDDDAVSALLVRLNTPGGAVLPSDDIRRAAAAFDGPTVAYATDTCASGGYWIASVCDEIWAHDVSIVGSIGVIGSSVNVHELAERLGVSYERFAAGKYKDAGTALKEPSEEERAYLQGIVDDYYDDFVERVAEGRDMDPETVRDTEARVYLGSDAHELGLVDELGTREDVEDRLAALLGTEAVSVREFSSGESLVSRLRGGTERVAFALGAGVASAFDDEASEFRFRL